MKDIEQLLANNKAWAEDVEKDMPGFFRKLENQHKPKFLWIGCSDSRVPADQLVGVMPGEVFVHRNISNQVINTDINLMCVLQYAIDFLRVKPLLSVAITTAEVLKPSLKTRLPGCWIIGWKTSKTSWNETAPPVWMKCASLTFACKYVIWR